MTKPLELHRNKRVRAAAAKRFRKIAGDIDARKYLPAGRGLCAEINHSDWNAARDGKSSLLMKRLIRAHVDTMNTKRRHFPKDFFGYTSREYAYAPGREWEARCLAALWMAHELEDATDSLDDTF